MTGMPRRGKLDQDLSEAPKSAESAIKALEANQKCTSNPFGRVPRRAAAKAGVAIAATLQVSTKRKKQDKQQQTEGDKSDQQVTQSCHGSVSERSSPERDSEGFAIPPPKKRRATECQTAAEEGTFETGSQGKGEGRTKSDGSQLSTVSRTAPLPEQPQRAGEDADARERPLTVETAAGQGCNRSIGGAPSRDSRDLPDSIVASHPKAADGDAKMESPHGTAEAGGPNGAREAETPTSAVVESALESEGQACDGTMGSTGEKAAENPEQKTVDKTGEGSAEIVGKPGGGAAGPPVEDKRPPGARSPLKHPIDLKKITYDDLVGRSHEIGPGGDYILLEKMRDMGEPESTVRWMRIMIEGMAPIERLQGRAGTSSSIPAQRPRPPPPPPRAPRAQHCTLPYRLQQRRAGLSRSEPPGFVRHKKQQAKPRTSGPVLEEEEVPPPAHVKAQQAFPAALEWCSELDEACVACKLTDSADRADDPDTLLVCNSCERKGIHIRCLEDQTGKALTEEDLEDGKWLCCPGCEEVDHYLSQMDGVRQAVHNSEDLTVEFVKYDESKRASKSSTAAAHSVFREAFDLTTMEPDTGINLLEHLLYQRAPGDSSQPDATEFRTVVLRKGGCTVCVACVRVWGTRFAEMPFVATKEGYRREGHLRTLVGFLTSTLASLGVSHLLAASSKRLYSMWCRSFSFSRCTPAEAECLSGHVTDPEDTVLLKRRLVDPSTGAAVKGDGSSVAQREEGHTKGGARRPNGGLAEGREGRDADGMAPGGPAPISRHVRCASESPSAEDPLRAPHPRVVPVRRHEVEAAARRLAEWLAAAEGGHDEYVRVGECMGRAAAVLRKVGAGAREEMARRLWRMLFRLGVNQQGASVMRHVAGEAMLCSLEERAHVDILSLAGVADVAVPLPSVHTPTALPGAAFVAALAGDALSDPPSGADGGPVEPGRGEAEVAGDDGKTAWGSGRVPLVPSAVGLKTEAAGRSSLRTNAIAQGSTDVVGGFGTGLEQAEERGEGQEAEGREGRMEDMAEESLSVRFMEGLSISSVRVEITDGREGGGSAAGMSKERPTEADASLSDDKPPAIPGPSPDIETAVGYLSAPRPASLTTQSLARYWLAAAGCKSDGAKNAGLGSLSGRMSHLSGLYESESFVIALPGAGLPETGAGVPAVPVVEVTFEPQEEPQEERDGESGLGSGRRSVDPCETARTALLASTPMAYQGLDLWGPLTQGGNEVECGAPETVQTQNCKGALHVARAEGLTVDEGDLARDIEALSRDLDPTLAVLRLCERWEEVAEEMDASGGGDALPHVAVLHQLLEDLV